MYPQFESYLFEECHISIHDSIIITVSGGIDSIVLLDLFSKLKIKSVIAHCNFQLRGSESDAEEEFVKELGRKYEIEVFTKHFDTEAYAEEHGISVQMAARELRYHWFEELRIELSFDFIATAHNLNDQIETFFINLIRGTGVKGLSGIKARTSELIRPLLWAERAEIIEYAENNKLEWREDSSNATTKYLRNKLRHEILPVFSDLNPAFTKTMLENISRIKEVENVFNDELERKKEELLLKEGNSYKILISDLLSQKHLKIWLFELLQDYGFGISVVEDIIDSLKRKQSGLNFYSQHYRIIKDRNYLFINEIEKNDNKRYYIEEEQKELTFPINLIMSQIPISNFSIEKNRDIAQLDFDKLNFPLILRKWEKGDYFMPLGMNNLKKLSDFFIDTKLPIPEKENTWILTSGKHIVWIVGQRIDDRYKITGSTEIVYRIDMKR